MKGRPRLNNSSTPNQRITLNTSADLRERLQTAATRNGRSLSEEVRFRVNVSFSTDDPLTQGMQTTYGIDNARLLSLITTILKGT